MGYETITHSGGSYQNFTPDDTFDTMYISAASWESRTCSEIKEIAENKWPGIKEGEIQFSTEYIHTQCLGYDEYDPSDYTCYLILQASKEYFKRNSEADCSHIKITLT